VLLYALGLLEVEWLALPDYVREKIDHRTARVSLFLTGRSTSNALFGLGKCRARWTQLSDESRTAWVQTLGGARGIVEMNAIELSQTVFSLGHMGVRWGSLGTMVLRETILRALDEQGPRMSSHGLSSAVWGLAAMGCEWRSLGENLRSCLVRLFNAEHQPLDQGHALSCSLALQALDMMGGGIDYFDRSSLIRSATLVAVAGEPDSVADMTTALYDLGLLDGESCSALRHTLMVKLRSSHAYITPSKLSALSSTLQKLSTEKN
jgi:hypothetical protein